MVFNGNNRVVTQELGVLLEQLFDLVELHVSIDKELLLLILLEVVLVEEGPLVASHKLLIDLPAELSHQLNDFIIHFTTLLVSCSIYTTESLAAVHVDPDFLETLLLLDRSLPELILLLKKVIVENILRLIDFNELLIGQ